MPVGIAELGYLDDLVREQVVIGLEMQSPVGVQVVAVCMGRILPIAMHAQPIGPLHGVAADLDPVQISAELRAIGFKAMMRD